MVEGLCNELGLKANNIKTKAMCFGLTLRRTPDLSLGKKQQEDGTSLPRLISWVRQYKYLGVLVDVQLDF